MNKNIIKHYYIIKKIKFYKISKILSFKKRNYKYLYFLVLKKMNLNEKHSIVR